MGMAVAAGWPAADRVYEIAEQATGRPLRRLCFEGPAEELLQTVNLQPSVVTTSLAILAAAVQEAGGEIGERFDLAVLPGPPSFLAGHSVGEYSALAAGGAIAIRQCLELVEERGRLMERAGSRRPGSMLALIGGSAMAAEEFCADIRDRVSGSYIGVANLNAPDQVVLAGDLESIGLAAKEAAARGFRRAIPLAVAGAFHSVAMLPAAAGLNNRLPALEIEAPRLPVISNIDARALADPAAIRRELAAQVSSPVRWADSIAHMAANGVADFWEVGPGQVLTGLARRIVAGGAATAIGDPEGVARLAARLKGIGE